MAYFSYHATNGRIVLTLHNTIHFRKTQSIQSLFLILRRSNSTFSLLNFNCCHCSQD